MIYGALLSSALGLAGGDTTDNKTTDDAPKRRFALCPPPQLLSNSDLMKQPQHTAAWMKSIW